MGLPWQVKMVHWHIPTPLHMLHHLCNGDMEISYSKNSGDFPHNGAMPLMSSTKSAIDSASHLTDSLANPAPAAPFACFGAYTMDAIRQLSGNLEVASTTTPTPTQPPRRTRAATPLTTPQDNADLHTPLMVPPAVTQRLTPRISPAPQPRGDPPKLSPPHRYLLHYHTRANYVV